MGRRVFPPLKRPERNETFIVKKNYFQTSKAGTGGTEMVLDPVVENLVKSAVNRCRERVVQAQKKVEGVMHGAGVPPVHPGPGGFTGSLKRSRGL
jgi:hypothetical protein